MNDDDWSFNDRGGYDGWCARGAGGSLTPEATAAAREILWGPQRSTPLTLEQEEAHARHLRERAALRGVVE